MAPKDTGLGSLSLIQTPPEPTPQAPKAQPKRSAKPQSKPKAAKTEKPEPFPEDKAARVGVMYRCTHVRRKALHQLALDRGVKVQTLLDEAVELLALQHDSKL